MTKLFQFRIQNILLLFLIVCLVCCKSSSSSNHFEKQHDIQYVITNVSVLPMTSETILSNKNVFIGEGKIIKISQDKPSEGAQIIDGQGKYLMPGFTEMHAHIPVAIEGDNALVKETLFLYISQGITTIRGMLGNPYHLDLKTQVEKGDFLGPRIYTSSPSLNGNSIKTPEEAKEKITQYQKDGYDFLKIHPGIKLEVWETVEKTAKEVGIPYAGHVPVEVGINRALASGYKTVDHLDGYLEGLVPISANIDPTKNGFFGYDFTELVDERLIDDLVKKTVDNKVGIVTTQTLFTRWFSPEAPEKLANEPEMQYMAPKTLFTWRQNKAKLINGDNYNTKQWERFVDIRTTILKKMDVAGVTFLLGSDAPQVFNVPGFSIHHELKAMAAAGISNFKILQAGTANPAVFFGEKGKYGTIEEGAAAEVVLLEGNPLEDLANAQKIVGVLIGETWLSKENIDQQLKKIAEGYLVE